MSHQLFQPIRVGRMDLSHRVVMAPLTRSRASVDHVVGDHMKEHYIMRSMIPGSLIFGEATFVTPRDMGIPFWHQQPGIWTPAQVEGWKQVVEAVHERGTFIYCQLASGGRLNSPELLQSLDPSIPYVSAGSTPVPGWSREPTPISREDIKNWVGYFADAASAAVHGAGFDGVELTATYFIEEFLKNISNDRTDEYGFQTPENAARFCLEIIDAIVERVGADRVGLKLNPWTRMKQFDGGIEQTNPVPVYSYLANEIRKRHPDFAFLHIVESRMVGDVDAVPGEGETNDFLREIWKGRPFLTDGGYKRNTALETTNKHDHDLVVFGRLFTSNPDLPIRLEHDLPLNHYNRPTFYVDGGEEGYNTFKYAEESKKILAGRGIDVSHL